MSNIQVQMWRAVPSINDSNRIMGQMNDAVQWDSGSLMNSELAVALLMNRHDHFLMVLAAAQLCFLHKQQPAFDMPGAGEGSSHLSVGSRCQLTKC